MVPLPRKTYRTLGNARSQTAAIREGDLAGRTFGHGGLMLSRGLVLTTATEGAGEEDRNAPPP